MNGKMNANFLCYLIRGHGQAKRLLFANFHTILISISWTLGVGHQIQSDLDHVDMINKMKSTSVMRRPLLQSAFLARSKTAKAKSKVFLCEGWGRVVLSCPGLFWSGLVWSCLVWSGLVTKSASHFTNFI